jgi:hypothetical protein
MEKKALAVLGELIEPSPDAPVYVARASMFVRLAAAVHEELVTRAMAPAEVRPVIDAAIERTLLEFHAAVEDWLEVVARQQGPALN